MKNNKILSGILAGAVLSIASITTINAEGVSANISLSSNYIWRGKTQNKEELAIQGGFDYDVGQGFSVGVWGSNVNFGDASSEFDFYASYAGEIEDIGYEVGYIAYRYPDDKTANFEEFYIGGSYALPTGEIGLTVYLGQDDADNYTELSYGATFEGVDVAVNYGTYGGNTDYKTYGVNFAKSYAGLDFGVGFTKTNDNAPENEESNTVFSVGKSF